MVERGVDEAATAGEDVASAGGRAAEDSGDLSDMCAAQSFTPDTNVVLADGKTVPIDQVKIGQKVKVVDTKTGKSVTRSVTAVWINHDTDLMDVTVTAADGTQSTIHATQRHPFWDLTTHSWVDADHLRGGDQLLADNGASVTFASAVVVPGAADMWDLTISGVHDFYISTATITVLVHNNSCSVKLGNNLENSGVIRPGESAAHHIVAANSRNAAEARGVLSKYGVDINSEVNGVFLPRNLGSANQLGAPVHSTLHTLDYYGEVNASLSSATSAEDVLSVLSALRSRLLGGGLG